MLGDRLQGAGEGLNGSGGAAALPVQEEPKSLFTSVQAYEVGEPADRRGIAATLYQGGSEGTQLLLAEPARCRPNRAMRRLLGEIGSREPVEIPLDLCFQAWWKGRPGEAVDLWPA